VPNIGSAHSGKLGGGDEDEDEDEDDEDEDESDPPPPAVTLSPCHLVTPPHPPPCHPNVTPILPPAYLSILYETTPPGVVAAGSDGHRLRRGNRPGCGQRPNVLPLALDDAFSFRKEVSFANDSKFWKATDEEMISFERLRVELRRGDRLRSPAADRRLLHLLLESPAAGRCHPALRVLAGKARRLRAGAGTDVQGSQGSFKSEFAVIGDPYLQDGRVNCLARRPHREWENRRIETILPLALVPFTRAAWPFPFRGRIFQADLPSQDSRPKRGQGCLIVNTQTPSILVGTRNRTVCVRVEGRGSFLNSTGLKEFAREMTNRGYREFVLDLRECPVMDSTFMGTMAGIALRLREIGQGELRVTNLNERNRDLLANLGLDQLFTMEDGASAPAVAAESSRRRAGADRRHRRRQGRAGQDDDRGARGLYRGEPGERRQVQGRPRVPQAGTASGAVRGHGGRRSLPAARRERCAFFRRLPRLQRRIEELDEARERVEQEETRVFDFLHGMGTTLSETTRPSDLHARIVNGALEVLRGSAGALYLSSEASGTLRPAFVPRIVRLLRDSRKGARGRWQELSAPQLPAASLTQTG